MAVNIEFFLKQKYDKFQLDKNIETEDLYIDIPNKYLKYLLAMMHQEFNSLIEFMYKKTNHHFNANESRLMIEYISLYKDMKFVLRDSTMSFDLNDGYKDFLEECNKFLKYSGGSEIPENLKHIQLIEYEPIFTLINSVKIVNESSEKRYPIKLIGEGSYSQVFKYKDENYDKNFVIKRAKSSLNLKERRTCSNEIYTV